MTGGEGPVRGGRGPCGWRSGLCRGRSQGGPPSHPQATSQPPGRRHHRRTPGRGDRACLADRRSPRRPGNGLRSRESRASRPACGSHAGAQEPPRRVRLDRCYFQATRAGTERERLRADRPSGMLIFPARCRLGLKIPLCESLRMMLTMQTQSDRGGGSKALCESAPGSPVVTNPWPEGPRVLPEKTGRRYDSLWVPSAVAG